MAKKPAQQHIVETVDLTPYMERDEDLGWLCNTRGMILLLRNCKNYAACGHKYVETTVDQDDPRLFHMKFELGKV